MKNPFERFKATREGEPPDAPVVLVNFGQFQNLEQGRVGHILPEDVKALAKMHPSHPSIAKPVIEDPREQQRAYIEQTVLPKLQSKGIVSRLTNRVQDALRGGDPQSTLARRTARRRTLTTPSGPGGGPPPVA